MQNIRQPIVAGRFYPSDAAQITLFLSKHIVPNNCTKKVKALILPHAGYIYSGTTAALTMKDIRVPNTVILLGPNHTGLGPPFSIMSQGVWRMPFGDIPIDQECAKALLQLCPLLCDDMRAHMNEHSLEVEIPFLHYINNDVNIVPITIGSHNLEDCARLGKALATYIADKDLLIVVSSDMTHYESERSANIKDRKAIDAILKLDEDSLAKVVMEFEISMCGFLPAYILLVALKMLGCERASLIDYRTSAEVSGDYEQVVGYVGMVFE